MSARPFGSAGPLVPEIGQGTWMMESRPAESIEALQLGLDLGLTHIDTAEMYGDGAVEELVGEAIRGRRDEVFLVSKLLPHNASRQGTIAACERSLRRLETGVLDVYLLHWPGSHPLEETVEAFEALVRAGKIRAWGVSNFDADELERLIAIAGSARKIACNQVLYHLNERAVEHAVLPVCERHGIALVAYSPFGQGDFPARDETLREIAAQYGTTPHAVALRWLLRHPSVLAIPKASTLGHVEANASAEDLVLAPEDLARIDAAFPLGAARRGVPML